VRERRAGRAANVSGAGLVGKVTILVC